MDLPYPRPEVDRGRLCCRLGGYLPRRARGPDAVRVGREPDVRENHPKNNPKAGTHPSLEMSWIGLLRSPSTWRPRTPPENGLARSGTRTGYIHRPRRPETRARYDAFLGRPPPTGTSALHGTPAARATGSPDTRSPARTIAVNGSPLLISMPFHRYGSVCRVPLLSWQAYSASACYPPAPRIAQPPGLHA